MNKIHTFDYFLNKYHKHKAFTLNGIKVKVMQIIVHCASSRYESFKQIICVDSFGKEYKFEYRGLK